MIIEKALVESVQLGTAVASYYTTSNKVKALIMRMTACNTSGAAVTLTVYFTPPGASPSAANALIWGKSIAAGATADIYQAVNHVLETAGTQIQAFASAASALTFRVSGYERPA